MTATSFALDILFRQPDFTSVTSPHPMIPNEISAMEEEEEEEEEEEKDAMISFLNETPTQFSKDDQV